MIFELLKFYEITGDKAIKFRFAWEFLIYQRINAKEHERRKQKNFRVFSRLLRANFLYVACHSG